MRSNWYVLALIIATLFVGCSKTAERSGFKVLIPWHLNGGSYSLQVIDLPTLKDPHTVSGDSAKIFIEPKFTDDGLRGAVPTAKFVETNEHVMIPSDFTSAQLFGVYAHTEKLWELDTVVGVSGLVSRPRKIGFNAKVIADNNAQLKNNASFFAKADGTLIMPYESDDIYPDKQLPLALNGGVLAHEHFHSLFSEVMGNLIRVDDEVSFLDGCALHDTEDGQHDEARNSERPRPIRPPKKRLSDIERHNHLVMRAINEGLADIWGWIYTGDDDFISHSLPEIGKRRNLKVKLTSPFPTTQDFFERSKAYPDNLKIILSYDLGTSIARQIRNDAERSLRLKVDASADFEARKKIAKYIIESLPKLKMIFEQRIKAEKLIETNVLAPDLKVIDRKSK